MWRVVLGWWEMWAAGCDDHGGRGVRGGVRTYAVASDVQIRVKYCLNFLSQECLTILLKSMNLLEWSSKIYHSRGPN